MTPLSALSHKPKNAFPNFGKAFFFACIFPLPQALSSTMLPQPPTAPASPRPAHGRGPVLKARTAAQGALQPASEGIGIPAKKPPNRVGSGALGYVWVIPRWGPAHGR